MKTSLKKQPANIDFLNVGRNCNQNCAQCFYTGDPDLLRLESNAETALIEALTKRYPSAAPFVYPKEMTTSMETIPLLREYGQRAFLTNGKALDEKKIETLVRAGFEEMKVTLFANATLQKRFNRNTAEEYQMIQENIRTAVAAGLRASVFTIHLKINQRISGRAL